MSAQNLMNGFAAYVDAEELAAQPAAEAREEQSLSVAVTLVTISLMHTYDTGC
ncbi:MULTISPECIES: LxmA leader domain family RiPP [Streptomyces]|uniref:LxmA leader domain family RiPP n=1 Tax=Streptomyces TaxID=1883 RepID=UPI000AB2459C|nr:MULTISPECIES: LxmA leader domain family RiPP [Streptomyces]MCH0558115.1 LxmA leader domain family RiPP [Streptomyces sp. MUM 16J]